MMTRRHHVMLGFVVLLSIVSCPATAQTDAPALKKEPDIDAPPGMPILGPEGLSVREYTVGQFTVDWPLAEGEHGRLVIDLRPGQPLIASIGIAATEVGEAAAIVKGVDPVTFLTVGTRVGESGRPPDMDPFNAFFDAPAKRPYQTYRSRLELEKRDLSDRVAVLRPSQLEYPSGLDSKKPIFFGDLGRLVITLKELTIGPFSGELRLTIYHGSRLIHVEAVVSTQEENRAVLYDAGLVGGSPGWKRLAWVDTEGKLQREEADRDSGDRPLAVRHRAIIAESDAGSLACFPPPHQYFFARDLTDNLRYAWTGRDHRGLEARTGFGIRQSEGGGGNYAPWINAPPGSEQHFGIFYLLARGPAETALKETLRYTHGDRFPKLPGNLTFTSHWHMAIALAAMKEEAEGKGRTTPDLVRMFKEMGVNIVHLAEFHGDGHPRDLGPLRLPEMEAMFRECRRLSDNELLFLPGEEANAHLGVKPGKNPGHWLYLFPKPVYWTMTRAEGQPFSEHQDRYGTVHHVGNEAEMLRLLETEHGLAWTAHPRIKASSWAPDIYKESLFYRSDIWLGAAWKGMPVDTSKPRLGSRVLNLFDDMLNWGGRKHVLGEVDVFKIDHTHELYGHMNVNYLKLDRLPRFDDDWTPVLDALRAGRFFVTTGEVLIRDFGIMRLEAMRNQTQYTFKADLEWTFPLKFAELISGDGEKVYRERIDLSDTGSFGQRTLNLTPDLRGRTWVRLEVWDVASNGAFTQPVWLTDGSPKGKP